MIGEQVGSGVEQFYADLEANGLQGLWRVQTQTNEPRTAAVPHLWRGAMLRAQLLRAGESMTMDRSAERRVLLLVNPGLRATNAATHTLTAAVQMIKPGEIAPTHRHSATAIRFIIDGHGAYTTVDGEKLTMAPGDLILTPNWTWHDHGNETDTPIFWMDGLDRPLVTSLNASFFEPYAEDRQAVMLPENYSARRYAGGHVRPTWERPAGVFSPQHAYPFAATYETLTHLARLGEASPYDDVAVEYVNPVTGGHALATLGCEIQLLRPGVHTKAHRHVSSSVYQVFRGRGYSVVNGQRLDWEQGDIFAVPTWAWHEHANASPSEEAILFSINDLPPMQALALYREQAYEANNGYQAD
ncbi:MAG TPA: cupin domain-containing protein [Chloroflexota bacterium]|nr:cupin domain-containing protein [Chloroflexota bacterium]